MKNLLFLFVLLSTLCRADDGYRLWLKYDLIKDAARRAEYAGAAQFIAAADKSPVVQTAAQELQAGLQGLLGKPVAMAPGAGGKTGGILLTVDANTNTANAEGYQITRRQNNIVVSAKTPAGVLYGTFALLRHLQTGQSLANLALSSSPKVKIRMLNHWDNVNGSIERGYAGSSLWKWYELPERLDPRYRDYARANASLGINGTVLNNVNASPRFMTTEYLRKVAALAGVFRPYGIKVYLSVYFPAPKTIGRLPGADPLDPQTQQWWNAKVKEIYGLIPDFGGFLVKANSEGEPGPQDYGRSHADGANMLGKALEPYEGVVLWRAFVYKADPKGDRFKAAYEEFKPFDGKFHPKVIVQVKNGPIDFQVREPFSPLFGAMPQTPLAMEFQLTQEYLGFATHLVFEAPLFKETLDSDTYAKGKGSTVAKVIDGSVHGYPLTAMAGVANTGSDRNWTGHTMGQANWYAYGRLAWDHTLPSEQIAGEWVRMTLTQEPNAVKRITNLLMRSRETYVDYTNPLGLHHIMGYGIHYGPEPWLDRAPRPDWRHTYYHRADSIGVGFDRTASGSNALALYAPEVQKQWNKPETCPLPYLLWFHHVPWTQKLSTGRTLWDELCTRYYSGAEAVAGMQKEWDAVRPAVDPEIFDDVAGRLAVQRKEALWWRDACVLYFQQFSKQPIPAPLPKPERTLAEVKELVDIYQMR
ncbi:alpha-glucuronidase family glycosyl hydrolase [Tellurirhabdus rosea]|uniref:alpha-glucuronidase family glycosyl hydrolase n=1 Tax=Tellurirhabdus rosea TaxID=2674997 RepID=UPI00225AB729|nr:alpha-glucuronidase family glycosyl hydrolase [Tellurirhabdus rosea]